MLDLKSNFSVKIAPEYYQLVLNILYVTVLGDVDYYA